MSAVNVTVSLSESTTAAREADELACGNGEEDGGGDRERVRERLVRLKPVERILLDLRYGEDLSLAEVAVRCGRSVGSIAQILLRVRRALRRGLGRHNCSRG